MSSLLLMRHGQACFDSDHYDQLSEIGEQQSLATGRYLKDRGVSFNQIFVGPRMRQIATAQRLAQSMDLAMPHQTVPALNEFADGNEVLAAAQAYFKIDTVGIRNLERKQQLAYYSALIDVWCRGEVVIAGRPSAQEFFATVSSWFHELGETAQPGSRILAVTSAGAIAALVCTVLGLDQRHLMRFTRVLGNASLTELVFSKGSCSLFSFNGTAHLPPELATTV